MLKATQGPSAFVEWFNCVLTLGSTQQCEALAMKLVDLHAMWTSDLILSVLGIQLFIFEVSRKFPPQQSKLTSRQWWLGWRDFFLQNHRKTKTVGRAIRSRPKVFRMDTPAFSEVSSIVHLSYASRSPRLNRVYLDRELPRVPDDGESNVSVLSLDSVLPKSIEDEEKAVLDGSKAKKGET